MKEFLQSDTLGVTVFIAALLTFYGATFIGYMWHERFKSSFLMLPLMVLLCLGAGSLISLLLATLLGVPSLLISFWVDQVTDSSALAVLSFVATYPLITGPIGYAVYKLHEKGILD